MVQKPHIEDASGNKYKYGFVTDIESQTIPKGLNEDIIKLISLKKSEPEWLLKKRLQAIEFWKNMSEPTWAKLCYEKIDLCNTCVINSFFITCLRKVRQELRKFRLYC